MAEEVKQTEQSEKKSAADVTKMLFKTIVGIVLVGLGVLAVIAWWPELLGVVKGCLGLFLILVGAITIAIARD